MQQALKEVQNAGVELLYGGDILEGTKYDEGHFVQPAIVKVENDFKIVQEETFAPILYLINMIVFRKL